MKETVSIIIPVYNSEPYLPRCLDSVLAQTYSEIEVLLIDDGSTDNSYSLCQQYAQSDSRVKVIHQDNQGASAARNTGLDNATGDYIMFCDSDDMVSQRWVEHHVCAVELEDKRIMSLSTFCHDPSELGQRKSESAVCNQFVPRDALYASGMIHYIGLNVIVLFIKSIIDKLQLRFRCQKERADYNEDLIFVTTYLQEVDGFVYTGYADYVYLTREDSLSRAENPCDYEKMTEKYEIFRSLIKQYGSEEDLRIIANRYYYHFLLGYKDAFKNNNFVRFKEIVTSSTVQECIFYADTSKEDSREMKLLKDKKVRALWFYHKLLKMKG